MNDEKSCLIIGGDKRQIHIAEMINKNGFHVMTYGLSEGFSYNSGELKERMKQNMIIILPLPVTRDNKTICSAFNNNIPLEDVIRSANKDNIVFGGMLNKNILAKFNSKNIEIYDYFCREEVTVLNTVPTVQGILKTVLENIDYTINSSKCAVFGYGRVGKLTASTFKALGSDVTVCARRESELAIAETNGLRREFINDFYKSAKDFDLIINTVPSLVVDRKIIENLSQSCFIVDVASYPFGTDFAAASDRGIKAVQCPSLPGKVAPVTAGKIIAHGIINILKERE